MTYEWRPILKWHMRSKIRSVIADNPGKPLSELPELADMTRQTFSKYVKEMRREGLVEVVKDSESFRITFFKLSGKGLRARDIDRMIQERFDELNKLRGR